MMKIMKTLIISFVTFAVGIGTGYFFFAGTPETKEVAEVKEITRIITKEVPVEVKVEDESALKEAREYYGKAFNLFLATVGYKLTGDSRKTFNNMLNDPKAYVESKPLSRAVVENNGPEVFLGDEGSLNVEVDWRANMTEDFKHIEDKKLIGQSKRFQLKEPSVFHARSKMIKKFSQIKKLNGRYDGKIYFTRGERKGTEDEVSLDINFNIKDENNIDGTFSLKLIRDGRPYSNSNGRGGNGDIRIKSGSILIDAGPGRFFHFRKKKIDIANFYIEGKFVGIARFTKR